MNVRELIEKLKLLDGDLPVMDASYREDGDCYVVEIVDEVHQISSTHTRLESPYIRIPLPERYVIITSDPISEVIK